MLETHLSLMTNKVTYNRANSRTQIFSSKWYQCLLVLKGAYIKYVGGRSGGFSKFLKKIFVAQETIDLNIS